MARKVKIEYEKSDQAFLRQHNTKKVLNIIRTHIKCPRVELAEIGNLDRKTITNITSELLEKKQIKLANLEYSGHGRPKEMLTINKDYLRCIGLDIGGTHLSGVILDFGGNVLSDSRIELYKNLDTDMLMDLCDLIFRQLFAQSHLSMEDIDSIGISFPGYLDPNTGRTRLAENMQNWHEIRLKDVFFNRYHKPILVDDCSRLMGLAEMWHGQGRGIDNFVVFDLGLGIGCGIVINGSIFAGSNREAGEIGHMIVEADGPLCTCGRQAALKPCHPAGL
jgi:hypothetical protein